MNNPHKDLSVYETTIRHMPSTPMTRDEMLEQCRLVSECPEFSEDDEWELY